MVASERARLTNMNCEVISTVKHDKSEPVVDITYGKNYRTTSNRRTLCDHDWSFAGFFSSYHHEGKLVFSTHLCELRIFL